MYDVIVVGARIAGSATGLLLARSGLDVLVVEQARFPSDTLSTHQMQVTGVARLARWGLLERALATGVPPTRWLQMTVGGILLDGPVASIDGIDLMISPRRTVLDALLAGAAREAGAQVREGTEATGLVEDDGRVCGVRCRSKGSKTEYTEHAKVLIGADGHHSRIARWVGAREYRAVPPRSFAMYTYWEGFALDNPQIHSGDGYAASAWPTNDGLVMTYAARPAYEFDACRRDVTAALLDTLGRTDGLAERARAGRQVGPTRCTIDLPNLFRQPVGPGWALVGDAGLTMDPITGLGMGHALRDAELASGAIAAGLDHGGRLEARLAGYARQRDRETRAIYDFTVGLAGLPAVTEPNRRLFDAIASTPERTADFFAAMSGARSINTFLSAPNLVALVGIRGFLRLMRSRPRARGADAPTASP